MAAPALTLPALDCPAVLLPTPGSLSNYFGGLAAYPHKLKALAVTTMQDEADSLIAIADDIESTLESARSLLDKYDPKFEKFRSPEKEWDIMMNKLVTEYPMYIQTEMLALIKTLVPIDFELTIMGITFDIVEVFTDPSSIKTSIRAEADKFYDMLPTEYKNYDKFETKELKAEAVFDYFQAEIKKKMNQLMHGGFGALISEFDTVWSPLGLPALPDLEGLDVKPLIKDKTAVELKAVSVFGFTLEDLLGELPDNNLEIEGYDRERLKNKARQFAEEWELYLLKTWMQKITAFLDAIGLGALTDLITFNFCDFMKLISFPPTIVLPASITSAVDNAVSSIPTLSV
tara:strand:+ start:41 stop:1075 length:1035 start_codon:yes stop_codon:yes gene_type:complete